MKTKHNQKMLTILTKLYTELDEPTFHSKDNMVQFFNTQNIQNSPNFENHVKKMASNIYPKEIESFFIDKESFTLVIEFEEDDTSNKIQIK